jgi:hypothetical protein
LEGDPDGIAGMKLAQEADVDLSGEHRLPEFPASGGGKGGGRWVSGRTRPTYREKEKVL